MFKKILIANRGEIACRVQRTCRALNVATVAVHSDVDASALFVKNADESVAIGSAAPSDSYLNAERIIEAALATGADAIHPGYGFLAENADFARACAKAGISFIGPAADVIELMGKKSAAKIAMQNAAVAVVPGYHGDEQSEQRLAAEARRIGYPLLIKASAGGGGKGMRVVRQDAGFAAQLNGARREAQGAFGNDHVILEKYLQRPRHIEVQIFGDRHGNVVHLFERECSIQRRYQKIIEETPSPFVDYKLREEITAAAVKAAQAMSYTNAGTVEFIVDETGDFYFMEMNTRLQVEHPITELVTGLDLVAWQLRIAAGEALPLTQEEIATRGHAIEARVYSEDPAREFLPSTGLLVRFTVPKTNDYVRVDTGVRSGDTISIHYDPMIAKIVAHGPTRNVAQTRLQGALARTAVLGPPSNLPMLRKILAHRDFATGRMDTTYVDRELTELIAVDTPSDAVLIAGALLQMLRRRLANSGDSPWDRADGFAANGQAQNRFALCTADGVTHTINLRGAAGRFDVEVDGRPATIDSVTRTDNWIELMIDGVATRVWAAAAGDALQIAHGFAAHELAAVPLYPVVRDEDDEAAHPGSPMPGRIVEIYVQPGQRVAIGDALLVLEGMKMEFTLAARRAGVVERILFSKGDMVDAEVPLVDLTPDEANSVERAT